MGRYASSRNFGHGKQMEYAAKVALRDHYGQGHYGTVATHVDRFTHFADWAREHGVRDLAKHDSRELTTAYAEHIKALIEAGDIAISTAQNRISTVNTVFAALRGDRYVQISPRDYAGSRNNIRTVAPAALDENRIEAAIATLRDTGFNRAAAVLELARAFGVRREEAIKADLNRWSREANRHGSVNVIDGTKGGRDADRFITVGNAQRHALANALAARPDGSRNLIAPHERYVDVAISRSSELNRARAVLIQHGLPGYHDSRSAYACQRYEQITGSPAPVVAGERIASKEQDREARAIISTELGHDRLDVLNSYIGSSR